MVLPALQPTQARLRLRESIATPDCLDLSRHSSSLLSPSLHPQLDFRSQDSFENGFPFQVSPTESAARSAQHKGQSASAQGQTSAMSKTHEAFLTSSGTPFGALTNTVPSKPRQPPQVLPSTPLWQTPVAHHYGHHQTHLQTPDVPQVPFSIMDVNSFTKSVALNPTMHMVCRVVSHMNRQTRSCPAGPVNPQAGTSEPLTLDVKAQCSSMASVPPQLDLACWKWMRSLTSTAALS